MFSLINLSFVLGLQPRTWKGRAKRHFSSLILTREKLLLCDKTEAQI